MSLVNTAPWMQALESQLDALALVRLFLSEAPPAIRGLKSWRVDEALLTAASPFAWSDEVVQAVIKAGESIPLDTPLNRWNLETEAVWWRFEKPLPFRTLTDASLGVRALCFGWIRTDAPDFGLPVCAWTDGHLDGARTAYAVSPSQTFEWDRGSTLGEMLEMTRTQHIKRYGPNGPDAGIAAIGLDEFMRATEALARFILAGLAWIGQKVLVAEPEHVERHRRKDFAKRTGREPLLRVVHLRKHYRAGGGDAPNEDRQPVEWACRWVVSGHWRNQACGPGRGDRKLTWIMPFVKGPEDKPMKAAPAKAYQVNR